MNKLICRRSEIAYRREMGGESSLSSRKDYNASVSSRSDKTRPKGTNKVVVAFT